MAAFRFLLTVLLSCATWLARASIFSLNARRDLNPNALVHVSRLLGLFDVGSPSEQNSELLRARRWSNVPLDPANVSLSWARSHLLGCGAGPDGVVDARGFKPYE